jgi:hypothetical protein
MAKVYNTYAEVLADATAGVLEWGDNAKGTGLVGFFWGHGLDVAQARAIIAAAHLSEPNQDWVKGGWLQVTLDGKNVIIDPGHAQQTPIDPSIIPPIPKVPKGFSSVTDFLNTLASPNLWVRIAEFVVGAILLTVGANALIKQSTGVNVAGAGRKVAKTAGKAAML